MYACIYVHAIAVFRSHVALGAATVHRRVIRMAWVENEIELLAIHLVTQVEISLGHVDLFLKRNSM